MGSKKSGFLSKNENRMLVTLLLGIGYPFIFTAFFPIFVFLILPLASFPYWLVVAGVWLIALAIVLPQMRSPISLGPGGYIVDPESTLDLHQIRSRGSTDNFLDSPDKKEEIFVNEHQRRLSSDSSEKSMTRLVLDSTQEPHQRSSTPLPERIFEERKAQEVDSEISERRSLLASDVVEQEETIVATKTTVKSRETSISTTYERTYECSLPSPEPTSPGGHTKNTVFIFVNNESENEQRAE